MTSKRRSNKINLLSLSFVSKCISKAFLIKIVIFTLQNHIVVITGNTVLLKACLSTIRTIIVMYKISAMAVTIVS